MREYIKSYRAFCSAIWLKLLAYIAYPAFMIIFLTGGFVICREQQAGNWFVYQIGENLILTAELFIGYLIFGGVVAKDGNRLEYLKTSVKGMKVLRNGLIMDLFRRVLVTTLIFGAALALSDEQIFNLTAVATILITIFFMELGLLIIRHISSFVVMILVLVVDSTVAGFFMGLGMFFEFGVVVTVLAAVLAGVMAVLGIRLVMKKARESYYDERIENQLEAA